KILYIFIYIRVQQAATPSRRTNTLRKPSPMNTIIMVAGSETTLPLPLLPVFSAVSPPAL
ncbi:MAG TPA: hypothetical protein PKY85_09855, partial [Nitrosomonas sp.]|nr:hypothetical protein [Nitrosomonas sp.]